MTFRTKEKSMITVKFNEKLLVKIKHTINIPTEPFKIPFVLKFYLLEAFIRQSESQKLFSVNVFCVVYYHYYGWMFVGPINMCFISISHKMCVCVSVLLLIYVVLLQKGWIN